MELSKHAIKRIEERKLKYQWILETIENPDKVDYISDTEVRYFKKIKSADNKVLKVVVNPERNIIITAYFDRGAKL
ncbi:MAG: hypothetical protein DSY47_05080 [Hydrogenothermus sp.]|nr:MAG: hypothetical protein DSY47_05080 [Hydrogenothermus sp.]